MAEKKQSKKKNTGAIIGGCIAAAVIIIVIIVVCVVMASKNNYNDAYFVSDGSKYVISYSEEDLELDDSSEYKPVKAHLVYYYNGDTITDMKAFYEFSDIETAKAAYNLYKDAGNGNFKEISLSGKYVVITANESEYANYSASDLKSQTEFNEAVKDAEINESSEEAESTENDAKTTEDESENE